MYACVIPMVLDPSVRLKPPCMAEALGLESRTRCRGWFGTDHLGRDVYARTVFGARISLTVGLAVAAIATSLGLVIGLLAGYVRLFDAIVMRVMDGLMAIPGILLAIALMALFGSSVQNLIIAISVPVLVIAYALMWVFPLQLGWFPVQGYKSISDGFGPFLHSIALPTVALGVIYVALMARITRASMMETLQEDYIRTARAKGVDNRSVLIRHALPNASVPIVTIIGIGIALLIGGVVVTESVFNISGLGRLAIDAALRRDYPVIQGVILVFSAAYVIVNLIIDLSYTVLDPRIRY